MLEIRTEIEIAAAPDKVWNALTDFERMPRWNPYIQKITGELKPGAVLSVRAQPSGSLASTFEPVVIKVDPGREFRWVGRLFRVGILDGEHIFTVEKISENRTRFVHREEFTGLLLPLHRIFRLAAGKRGFEEMNRALKAHIESSPTDLSDRLPQRGVS